MEKVNVKEILDSVLAESGTTRQGLLDILVNGILDVTSRAKAENSNEEPLVILVSELGIQMVEREMAIYENVEKTLQRVIDELSSASR